VSQYAQITDVPIYGVQAAAVAVLSPTQQTGGLIAASSVIDSYFAGRYRLPLQSWDVATTMYTVWVAVHLLLNVRGYNPQAGSDSNVLNNYNLAIEWARRVQKQEAHPQVVPAADQSPDYDAPRVLTTAPRGWERGGVR
jgi:phage gp36-like protein